MDYSDISREFLTQEEVQHLTGAKHLTAQTNWLRDRGWIFEINRCNSIIIGRHYLRLRLSGLKTSEMQLQPSNQPRFENVS
ncbi:DUF4224 domain-containing protein [uncultured Methylophaga sp.]|uniref:DUF4224 domain-containing protein n=1 Tax=uncultured Methylophaga sp. TaxID=285271 RepID=UPI003457A1BE